jgi:hypothetical protein
MNPLRIALGTALVAFAVPCGASASDEPPAPVVAPSPRAGGDLLRLHDGTLLRGQIAERRPDGTITLVLLTGEARTIPGEQIASVTGATTSPSPPPPPPGTEQDRGPALTREPRSGRVPLQIESTGEPLTVGMPFGPSAAQTGRMLCQTPCTVYVYPGSVAVWTGGPNMRASALTIQVPQGGYRVRLRAASVSGGIIGQYVAVLGGIGVLAGGIAFGASLEGGQLRSGTLMAAGGGALLGGGGLLALGLWLYFSNQPGAQSEGPLEPRRASARVPVQRWSLEAMPLPGGGLLAAGAVF